MAALAPWRIYSKLVYQPWVVLHNKKKKDFSPLSPSFHDIYQILHLYRKELFPWRYRLWRSRSIPRLVLRMEKATWIQGTLKTGEVKRGNKVNLPRSIRYSGPVKSRSALQHRITCIANREDFEQSFKPFGRPNKYWQIHCHLFIRCPSRIPACNQRDVGLDVTLLNNSYKASTNR